MEDAEPVALVLRHVTPQSFPPTAVASSAVQHTGNPLVVTIRAGAKMKITRSAPAAPNGNGAEASTGTGDGAGAPDAAAAAMAAAAGEASSEEESVVRAPSPPSPPVGDEKEDEEKKNKKRTVAAWWYCLCALLAVILIAGLAGGLAGQSSPSPSVGDAPPSLSATGTVKVVSFQVWVPVPGSVIANDNGGIATSLLLDVEGALTTTSSSSSSSSTIMPVNLTSLVILGISTNVTDASGFTNITVERAFSSTPAAANRLLRQQQQQQQQPLPPSSSRGRGRLLSGSNANLTAAAAAAAECVALRSTVTTRTVRSLLTIVVECDPAGAAGSGCVGHMLSSLMELWTNRSRVEEVFVGTLEALTACTGKNVTWDTIFVENMNPPSVVAIPVSPSPTPTASTSPSTTPSASLGASASSSPTPTVSDSPTQTPSRSPSGTGTPSSSPPASASGTPTSSPTSSTTPTVSDSPTQTPSTTATPSQTPSTTVSPSQTPSTTVSPSQTPSSTGSDSPTPSQSPTPSDTPTSSTTPSNTPSQTPSTTVSPSQTPSTTVSPSQTPSTTVSPSQTPTPSRTPSQSSTPTPTPSVTPSRTATPSPTTTPSVSSTPAPTSFRRGEPAIFSGQCGEQAQALSGIMRPTDVAFDASGRSLLIAEEVTGVVRRVSPVGSPSLVPILFPLIGDGVRQHGGDFGPAIEGSIHSPRHVTVSRDTDDVYITDVNTMVIRKVERDPASPVGAGAVGNSTITTFAGGITIISPTNSYTGSFGDGAPNATRVLMEKPGALVYSRTRNSVYIADTHLHTIRVLNLTSGVLSHFGGIATYNGAFAGDGLHVRSARFKTILGLSFNSAEDVLYVADSQNHIIRAINMTTNVIRTVVGRPTMQGFSGDGALATSALLSIPAFASVSPDTGILYVVDNANNRLRAVDPRTGVITSISGGACSADEAVTNFTGTSTLHKNLRIVLAVPGGRVFIVDTGRSRVFLYNELTGFTTLFCGTMNSPSAMDWDPVTSTLYVFDKSSSRVFRCTSASTTPTAVAGTGSQGNAGDNGPALSATFRNAEGLAVVGNGTFVVADTENRRLRLVTLFPSRVSALAGSGVVTIGEWCVGPDAPATCSRLVTETPFPTTANPAEVAVGPGGDVFLSAGTSIRRVSALDGTITIFAGSATKAHGGDGLPYTQATFSNVRGLAFSPDLSVLYAIDNGALRVRALNMSGGPTRTIIGTGSTSLLPQDGVPASTASLFDPSSIAVHPTSGLVYISDRYCIRSVDVLNDTTRLVAGNGVTNGAPVDFSSARLGAISPRYQANGVWVGGGLDISPDGSTLAYADTGSNRVRGIDLASGITYSIAGGGTCAANVVQPNNAFFHPSTRTLLVADTGAGTIRQMTVTLDGLPATSPSNVLLGTSARAVVRDNSSFLYVSDNLSIVRRNLNTSTSVTVVGSADRNLINAGLGTDNVPGLLTLVRPAGLRLDPSGRYLYIADTSFHRVLRYEVATGTVTTVAGGGAAMSCGDGGPAADAGAYDVGGITTDAAGNVYFSDGSFTNMVRVVSAATGVVTRLAGSLGTSSSAGGFNFPSYGGDGGPALSAIFQRPTLVQMKNGLLYVYDMNNYRLRAINMTTGNITTVVGNGASAYSAAAVQNEVPALLSPVNIRAFQVASDGTIFFAETTGAGYFVRKFNPATGNVSIVLGKVNVLASDPVDRKLGTDTALGYIVGLALHPITGDLYVATSSPSTVRILYASNSTVNTWGSGVVAEDLTMNDAGDMAFMQLHNPSQSYVLRFLPAGQPPSAAITVASVDTLGTCGYTAENSPARGFFLTKLSMTLHLAANRSIYVATTRRILHFPDPTGNGTVRFLVGRGSFTGCSGSPGTQINLNQPNGVDADADGNVYIADRSNARVWRVGPDGIATTLVGNPSFLPSQSNSAGFSGDDGPASLARVSNPMDVIHDAQTNVLYISDRGNSRIRYVNLTNTPPTIHTLAGTDSIDASVASGLRPTDTALVTLHGLTIDSQRRVLYVVEESGPRVRAIPMAGS